MGKIGAVIETNKGQIKDACFGMITLARQQKAEIYAFVIDDLTNKIENDLSEYGVKNLIDIKLSIDNPLLRAKAIVNAMKEFDICKVFGISTAFGKDILPRIAACLDAPLVMDCVDVNLETNIASKSQYSGKTTAQIHVAGNTVLFGIRPNSVLPAKASVPCNIQILPFKMDIKEPDSFKLVQDDSDKADMEAQANQASLAEADIIIAGGRGMKNKENFSVLFECAKKINAVVGASRVAVDSNWVPYAMQVGQTGEKVSPQVYLACGISGSIQHFAGMKTSKMVIAVNIDKEAAIMNNCDYYVNADLFEVIPELTKQL